MAKEWKRKGTASLDDLFPGLFGSGKASWR
jgi:hypothetical protein